MKQLNSEVPSTLPFQPGRVLALLLQLRERVRDSRASGARLKWCSAAELVSLVRPVADGLGLLVYPAAASGRGYVADDETVAEVTLTVRVQAVEDGSYLDFAGYGLGVAEDDTAGGKAGTYAFKAAMIQALMLDADAAPAAKPATKVRTHEDQRQPLTQPLTQQPTLASVRSELAGARDRAGYRRAHSSAMKLRTEEQIAIADDFRAAKRRLGL